MTRRSPIFEHAADMYREMRQEFELVLEAAYANAENGTHGSLLNREGRTKPVDAYSLLTGPWSRVLKYGSEELIEWFLEVGRPSVQQFEREWFTSWLNSTLEPAYIPELEPPADRLTPEAEQQLRDKFEAVTGDRPYLPERW
jgi:hypothetical protein